MAYKQQSMDVLKQVSDQLKSHEATLTWLSNASAIYDSNTCTSILALSKASLACDSWTSNVAQASLSESLTQTNTTWFGQPVLSKSYSVSPYETDVVIDKSLTMGNISIMSCGGSAFFNNNVIAIPAGPITTLPTFNVTPYITAAGFKCSTSEPLEKLDIWIKFVYTH